MANNGGIFSSNVPAIKSFKLGKSVINANGKTFICAGAQFTFSRQITPVSPLNLDTKYMIIGDESGQGTLSLIVGPESQVKEFITTYSDACAGGKDITLTATNECASGTGTTTKFTLKGVVISSLTGNVTRAEGMMTVSVQFQFVGLEMS